ncbi:hypothetical protein QQP08_000514 [Theobroma cacao]|nr:hypothetical protein QQP08_000514 [Theobroma cacao]
MVGRFYGFACKHANATCTIETTPFATRLLGGWRRWFATSLSNVWRVIRDEDKDDANDDDNDEAKVKMRSSGWLPLIISSVSTPKL